MIVREMPNEQLLCIHQTSHALMAADFCRHWGNRDFAPPQPYGPTMIAIAQHDNGWYEWEQRPKLRPDGYPMDFVNDPDVVAKVQLWRRSVDRSAAQHPYAGILVGRHASLLYQDSFDQIASEEARAHVAEFIADQQLLLELFRMQAADAPQMQRWLSDERIDANSRLLQFGDRASLQLIMPWASERLFPLCPLDGQGTMVSIRMQFDEETVTFDPWPYHVGEFTVTMEGWLLSRRTFATEAAYHTALAEAPFYRQTWRVVPA